MASSLFFALGSVISKKLPQNENPFLLTGTRSCSLGGACAARHRFSRRWKRSARFRPRVLRCSLYLIALSAAAFTIWTSLMRRLRRGERFPIYFFLLPVFGVAAFSGLFLGEQVADGSQPSAALLFVCAGIYVVNSRPRVNISTPAA